MTNSTSDPEKATHVQSVTITEFARLLQKARKDHRQIVPIVGAGLSADSGFPVINAIVRYFGKLYKYIEQHGPLRLEGVPEINYLITLFEEYAEKPWRFVEDFGWPDRFQLNQDLDASLRENVLNDEAERMVESAVRSGLDKVLPRVNQTGARKYDELRNDVYEITEGLGGFNKALLAKPRKAGEDPIITAVRSIRRRLEISGLNSTAFDIIGDWRRLILFFTNYRSDYADALFARFGSSRQPGQGHRFLAFLIRFLAIPTVFTFNFDSLIEQALDSDGAPPKVFAMERGAGLPHPGLVRDRLSVIKMHGSTHALLLDEQLDRPLSEEYLKRFAEITGSNPLLLVVGCSDSDQRLRDIVSEVVKNASPCTPSVLWLHYEPKSPLFLNKLISEGDPKTHEKILACPTNNPGATLQHLYLWLTGCQPAGSFPYLAHVEPPVHMRKELPDSHPASAPQERNRFELISSLSTEPLGPSKETPIPSASHVLLERANDWTRNGYHFIWIDLEALHTFAGVVGAIIDQCRKYDPDLAPSVLPVDIDSLSDKGQEEFLHDTIGIAVNRVARALRRARYYLALDGLETYAWPATTHHGLSHMAIQNNARRRLKNLGEFLRRLVGLKEGLGESLVGISVDRPISRHEKDLSVHLALDKVVGQLSRQRRCINSVPEKKKNFVFDERFEYLTDDVPLLSLKKQEPAEPSNDYDIPSARTALILFNLSCYRRIRPLLAVRHLIEPLLEKNEKQENDRVERVLQVLISQLGSDVLKQLEGGGFWFTRTIRNLVYSWNTKHTDTDAMSECLDGVDKDDKPVKNREQVCKRSAFQLCLAAMTHQRIARIWYTRTFVQSQDTFSFLEYTYHRISSVRNLVKLRRLVQVARIEGTEIREAVLGGIHSWVKLNGDVNSQQADAKQPEFENDDFINELPELRPDHRKFDAATLLDKIEKFLERRHGDELGSLYRAWTRSEVALRTQVPAEQLLHWCNELLTDDLKHRCNHVVVRYRGRGKRKDQPPFKLEHHKLQLKVGQGDELIDESIEKGVIREFRQYLQNLQAKLWMERSDYQTCIRERWGHLLDANPEMRAAMVKDKDYEISKEGPVDLEKAKLLEKDRRLLRSCDAEQCHLLLDIANCKLQWEVESGYTDSDITENRKAPMRLLKRIRIQLRRREALWKQTVSEQQTAGEDQSVGEGRPTNALPIASKDRPATPAEFIHLNEAWLRLLHLQAENQMGRTTVFTHDGFDAEPDKWMPDCLALGQVRKTISEGLERIKTHDSRTHQAPRSVLMDPTTDGALYLQYRSVFYMLKGRTEWQSRIANFDRAQWCFEMARGGLGNNSPLMMALIDLYSVEALLGSARKLLRDADSDEQAKKACDEAWGLYESAHGGLERARESLLASRRNVIWRKFFFRLTTQYHSDRLLLGYARLKSKLEKMRAPLNSGEDNDKEKQREECKVLLRLLLRRLRRAYQSLLTALDLYLPQPFDLKQKNPCPNRFRWLYRMWWELTLSGHAIGRLGLSLDPDIKRDPAREFINGQIRWLNEIGGIKSSVLGRDIEGKYELLENAYDEIVKNPDNLHGAKRALDERKKFIDAAMEAAKPRVIQ